MESADFDRGAMGSPNPIMCDVRAKGCQGDPSLQS